MIEDKAKGQKRHAPPPQPDRSNVIDLVAALQESLAQKKPRKREPRIKGSEFTQKRLEGRLTNPSFLWTGRILERKAAVSSLGKTLAVEIAP